MVTNSTGRPDRHPDIRSPVFSSPDPMAISCWGVGSVSICAAWPSCEELPSPVGLFSKQACLLESLLLG
eukprot:5351130-Alexandrium_andersonii.AAC.1